MATEIITKDNTSQIIEVVLRSSTTGQPLTGIAFGDVTIKEHRQGASPTTRTAITMTAGTWASIGWIETSDTGVYQFGVPNAGIATGAESVTYTFTATGAITASTKIVLTEFNLKSAELQTDWADGGRLDLILDIIAVDTTTEIPALIGGIASTGGAALPVEATSDNAGGAIIDSVTILGTETGTFANTEADDAIYHVITGTATALDWVYGFVLGGGYVASSVSFKGYLTGQNDSVTVQAWNGATWDDRFIIDGSAGSSDQQVSISLLSKHTTAAGDVYIRFVATGMTFPVLNINELAILKVSTSRTVGYNEGISVDTLVGIAGVEPWVNGVGDRPALTWADAQTIGGLVGLSHYHIANGSSIQLDRASDNLEISGDEYLVDFNGQSIDNTSVKNGLAMYGSFLGYPHLLHIAVGSAGITGPGAKVGYAAIRGKIISTDGAVGNRWVLHNCWGVDETTSEFDFGAAVATAQVVYITAWDGPLKISNMNTAGDKLYLSGNGVLVIDASCTNGTFYIAGQWTVTNNGSSTIVYDDDTTALATAQNDLDIITGASGVNLLTATQASIDAIEADTGELQSDDVPGLIAALNDVAATDIVSNGAITTLSGAVVNVDLVDVTTANTDMLAVADIADAVWDEVITKAAHNVSNSAAEYLRLLKQGSSTTESAVDDPGAAATTTVFNTDLTEADDFWNDNVLVFTSGSLEGQSRPIADFANTNGQITLDEPLTATPANNDEFVIHSMHIHPVSQIALAVLSDGVALNTTAGVLDTVNLVNTTNINSDMRGTDSALLAASTPANWSSMSISAGGVVDGNLEQISGSAIVESSSGRIAGNFNTFYDNADAATTSTLDDVGGVGDDAATIYTYFTSLSREDTFKADLTTIDGKIDTGNAVLVKVESTLEADGAGGWQFTSLALENAGSVECVPAEGAYSFLGYATLAGAPQDGAEVWIMNSANTTPIQGPLLSGSTGYTETEFSLDSGTYLMKAQKGGVNYDSMLITIPDDIVPTTTTTTTT